MLNPLNGFNVATKRVLKLCFAMLPATWLRRTSGLLTALCASSSGLFIAPNLPSGA